MKRKNSIRLQGYDYSLAGLYFLTLCTQNRMMLFGKIENQQMISNDAGKMITEWYNELENKFSNIQCHEMVVMPNHMHCIIQILDNTNILDTHVGVSLRGHPNANEHAEITDNHTRLPQQKTGIPQIMEWYKTMTTNAYIRGVKQYNWQSFEKKIWQRSYHDHIIRNNKSYENIRNYIITNPERWDTDTYNKQ